MKAPVLAVALLFAFDVVAEELYVPLGGGRARTELRIANSSARGVSVALEVLGGEAARIEVGAEETVRWTHAEGEAPSVLRIIGDDALQVTAVRHCDACRASASVPVVSGTRRVDAAAVPVRTEGEWRSGIMIVNPADAPALVTVDGAVHVLAPNGVLHGSTFQAQTPLLAFAYDTNVTTGAKVFAAIAPMAQTRKRRSVRSGFPGPQQQTVVLTPSRDNTLFEEAQGERSNGVGVHLFAGATASDSRRRALLAFDIAAQVPPGSRITSVTLTMHVSMTITGSQPMALHRVSANWGEGLSNAGFSRDGIGARSRPGDATWVYRFFPESLWSTTGGDFERTADAATVINGASGTWESAAMVARVQQWLDEPATNFGWIVIGNEDESTTAKRFDSREMQPAVSQPTLTIELVK